MSAVRPVNSLKARLAEGRISLCMSVRITHSVEIARIAHAAGYDALYVDLEHGSLSHQEAASICVAAMGTSVTPLVRMPSQDGAAAAKILESGALGLVIPHVKSAAEIREVLAACRFPPDGHRSLGGGGVHFGYRAGPAAEFMRVLTAETLIIAMIESREGVFAAEQIAAVDGVDGLLIGTNDLMADFGIRGSANHPEILSAFATVDRACKAHGKFLGAGGVKNDPEVLGKVVEIGATFISAAADASILASGLLKQANAIRAAVENQEQRP